MELPELVGRRQLRHDGYTDDEVRRWLRTGRLTTVRRGTYLRGGPPATPVAAHTAAAAAALGELAAGTVASHVTAAVLHGMPIWRIPLGRVHVTRHRRTGGRSGTRVHVHTAPLAADEITVVAGLLVTTPARTVVDLARTTPFEESVAVADGALRSGLTTPAGLSDAVRRARGRPGAPAARRVAAFADGRSESVGESRSRVAIARAGLPAPQLQWEVRDGRGRRVARSDFGWPERRAVGEFDGEIKYGRLLQPGETPGEAVFREKRREDAVRAEGLAVVRWTWPDLADFAPTATQLRRWFRPA